MIKFNKNVPHIKDLIKLKVIKDLRLKVIQVGVRDSVNINVIRDNKTGIIFLDKISTSENYYKKKITSTSPSELTQPIVIKNKVEYLKKISDTRTRMRVIKDIIKNKQVCDFGSGYGANLKPIKDNCKELSAVEISKIGIKNIKNNYPSIKIKKKISDFKINFDVITMFHVFAHLPKPINQLKEISKKIKKNGSLVIETLHANDFLANTVKIKSYCEFRYSKEFLIFHTAESLKAILKKLKFKNIKIHYIQRYGLANHLGWIVDNKPGGHITYKKLFTKKDDEIYKNDLVKNKLTDTILIIAKKI